MTGQQVTGTGDGRAQVITMPTAADVAQELADEFAAAARESIARSGRFTVALAGGNTPREAYLRIAEGEVNGTRCLPWNDIHVFFGDERPVPLDDAASNFRMAQESLLARVPIPPANVHRVRTELGEEAAAQDYERQLHEFFPENDSASFDLVLLGMGPDGHTASLFPDTEALREQSRLFVPNWVEKLKQRRLTLTLPMINRAARVVFTVVGKDKASMLQEVLDGREAGKYPSQQVRPASGWLRWIIDEEAAQLLPRKVDLRPTA